MGPLARVAVQTGLGESCRARVSMPDQIDPQSCAPDGSVESLGDRGVEGAWELSRREGGPAMWSSTAADLVGETGVEETRVGRRRAQTSLRDKHRLGP